MEPEPAVVVASLAIGKLHSSIGVVMGILLGWLVYQGLLALVRHEAAISFPEEFAPAVPLITLVGVLVPRLLAVRGSLRRATRIQPGTALWCR